MKTIILLFSVVFMFCFISCESKSEKEPPSSTKQTEPKQTKTEKASEPPLVQNIKPVVPTKTRQKESDCMLNKMYYSDGTAYGKSLCRQGEWVKQ